MADTEGFERIYVDVTQPAEGPKKAFAEKYQAVNPPVVIVLDRGGRIVAAYRSAPNVETFIGKLEKANTPTKTGG